MPCPVCVPTKKLGSLLLLPVLDALVVVGAAAALVVVGAAALVVIGAAALVVVGAGAGVEVALFVVVGAGWAACEEVVGIGAALATAAEDAAEVDEGTAAEDERCLQRWVLARLRTRCPGMAMGAGAATRAAMAWWRAAWRTAWGVARPWAAAAKAARRTRHFAKAMLTVGDGEKKGGFYRKRAERNEENEGKSRISESGRATTGNPSPLFGSRVWSVANLHAPHARRHENLLLQLA